MKHLLDTKVGPYQAMIPMVDVDTIGAGGGSIAYVDPGGIFRVGPRSAGADPGPGRLRPRRHRADRDRRDGQPRLAAARRRSSAAAMALRADLARTAFEEGPARALGMSVEEASMGAVQILTHSMVQSIEENSVRKGFDPRDFALVAEGGAGPLFAAQIALEVGHPVGARAALPGDHRGDGPARDRHGLRVRRDGLPAALDARRAPRCSARSRSSRSRRAAQLEDDGVPADRIVIQRIADCRYLGQGYELRVDVASGAIDDDWIEKVRADFHDIHEREYSRRFEESDIEIPNVRVRGDRADAAARDARGRARRASRPRRRSGTRARRGSGSAASSRRCRRATTSARR